MNTETVTTTHRGPLNPGPFLTEAEAREELDWPVFIKITSVYQDTLTGKWWRHFASTTTLPSFSDELGMILLPTFQRLVDILVRLVRRKQ